MILIDATIKYKGYSPLALTKGSAKRICVSCDNCGRVRWVEFKSYRSLCRICCQIGIQANENHWNYGKHWSKEVKDKMSKSSEGKKFIPKIVKNKMSGMNHWAYGLRSENAPAWKGGTDKQQKYLVPIIHCNQLNKRFKNSCEHHINYNTVIFIPKDLHKHIYHNLKSGQGVNEMNILAFQYMNGVYKC